MEAPSTIFYLQAWSGSLSHYLGFNKVRNNICEKQLFNRALLVKVNSTIINELANGRKKNILTPIINLMNP